MKRRLVSALTPHPQDLLFILVFTPVIHYGSYLFRDGDPGRHVSAGVYMLQTRTILSHDIFSYTMHGQPLTPHEWLAQIAFGAFHLAFGLGGLVLLAALLIATTCVLVYRENTRQNAAPLVAFGLALWAAAMTSAHWLARPHLFTLLFLALWTPGLRRIAQGDPVTLWRFPLIMLFWANTHGAFIAGFAVWVVYLGGWAWDSWRRREKPSRVILRNLLLAGGASFLVTLVNPVGWKLWATSLGYVMNRYLVDLTSEYRSLNFHTSGAWPFLAFLVFTLLLLSRSSKKMPTSEGLLLAIWTGLALYSGRNMPLFAVIATPIVAGSIHLRMDGATHAGRSAQPVNGASRQLPGILWPATIVALAASAMAAGWNLEHGRRRYAFNNVDFPVAAVDWLEGHPQAGNMYNFFPWGGYLIYRLWPEENVFIDGQLDFYGEAFTRRYQGVMKAEDGWERTLRQFQVQWMLVPPNEPIALALRRDPTWFVSYEDRTAVIVRRR